MATLKEIAECTGYSITTISRVLNNDPTMSVSDTTRSAILEAAGKLRYSVSAKQRRGQAGAQTVRRFAIAQMLSPVEQLSDPYYLYLKNYAEQRCFDLEYSVVHLTEQRGNYLLPSADPIDGVLAIGIFSEVQVEALFRLSRNLVFLDSSPDDLKYDAVVLNFRLGVEQALDYLLRNGHTQIGFLGPDCKLDQKKRPAPEVRRQYFIEYMKRKELFSPTLLLDTVMDAKNARRAVEKRMQSQEPMPTALLAANEECAIGAIGTLHAHGLHVPQDMSVISFNDTPLSALVDPPLTSVSTHVEEMSHVAIEMLIRRIAGDTIDIPIKIMVPPSLIVRESVKNLLSSV